MEISIKDCMDAGEKKRARTEEVEDGKVDSPAARSGDSSGCATDASKPSCDSDRDVKDAQKVRYPRALWVNRPVYNAFEQDARERRRVSLGHMFARLSCKAVHQTGGLQSALTATYSPFPTVGRTVLLCTSLATGLCWPSLVDTVVSWGGLTSPLSCASRPEAGTF